MENSTQEEALEELNSRHRKERKELQCTIQSLKKSATKGDKKKRKEVLEKASLMETNLEKQQNDELNALQNQRNADTPQADVTSEDMETVTNLADDLDIQPRMSKAQKRRNKKALEEKQREADILANEEENKNGPRMLESRAVEDILKKRNLCLYPIASDGDCLYNAVQHQLEMTGRGYFTVDQLRHETANYILENKQNLIFYMTNSNTGELLTDDDFINYCENIRNTPAWGGQVEIKALSSAFRVPIEVLQATGPPTIQGAEYSGPNLLVTYHRHMYSLGEHYNSTRPIEDSDRDENEVGEKESGGVS